MSLANTPSLGSLVAAARVLKPMLAAQALEAEQARDLPKKTVAALKEAGLHRVYMPRAFGGYEMDWGAHYAVARPVAEACGAAGWITSLVFSHVMWIARLNGKVQDEYFSKKPDSIFATGSAGGGMLTPVAGGFKLTGRWAFLSGVSHAGGAMVIAKTEGAKIFSHFVLLLEGEYEIEPTWDSDGLRGTGSHHIRVTDRFIPAHRAMTREEMTSGVPEGSRLHQSYVYRVKPAPYQKSWFAAPLLGAATGAMESYLDQTRARVGALFGESIVTQTPVQVRIGESLAELETAELIFDRYCEFLHEKGAKGEDIEGDEYLRTKRQMAIGAQLCLSAANRLSTMMGVTGQTAKNPVQRLYRDIRTISTHIELNWDHAMQPTGQAKLGLPTGDPSVDGPMKLGPKSEEGRGVSTRI